MEIKKFLHKSVWNLQLAKASWCQIANIYCV